MNMKTNYLTTANAAKIQPKLAFLTNGRHWHFYLHPTEDHHGLRLFLVLNIINDESDEVERRLRKCLKSILGSGSNVDMGAPKVVFHEQREISKRPERQRMATLGTVAACSQTSRPADQIPAQGGGERYSLCVAHRMRMANAPSRPASVAQNVPLLPHLAWRWDHGADT